MSCLPASLVLCGGGASPVSPPVAAVHTESVRGELHRLDGVANQDKVFHANLGPVLSVCLLDGHGDEGSSISAVAANAIHKALSDVLSDKVPAFPPPDLAQAAMLAFRAAAAACSAADAGRHSGTTATLALVRGWECVIAHVGDSAAAVVTQRRVSRECAVRFDTPMHRPGVRAEDARIEKAGGILAEGYIVDQVSKSKGISITRTLGDVDMTVNGCISEPEIRTIALSKRDRAIVIASDGLWDTKGISFKSVSAAVSQARGDPDAACAALLQQVENGGGASDDCTVAVITLQRPK